VYGHSLLCNEATDVTRLICTYPECYWPAVNRADNVFQGSIFWSRAAYERFGGLDTGLSFAMEYPLIHYLMREESGVFLNSPLAAFRQHGDQKTRILHAVGEHELRLLYGTIQLPLHWAALMFATRFYRLVSNRNLVQKLRIAAHGLVVSRNQRAATPS
jgi:hypothetical protein